MHRLKQRLPSRGTALRLGWIVWAIWWTGMNVVGWLTSDGWWGWPLLVFFLGVMVWQGYLLGLDYGLKRQHKLVMDQNALLKEMNDYIEKLDARTIPMPAVIVKGDGQGDEVEIRYAVCLN